MRRVCLQVAWSCVCLWFGTSTPAAAWGAAAHAVIGQLVEDDLLRHDVGLTALLDRLRAARHRQQIRAALHDMEPPQPGTALRFFANWPDWHKRQPGMLANDDRRHYVNLPLRARYDHTRHCPDGACSIETLLQQRAVLADRQVPLPQRAVALAWVTHLVGDIHQPLHAGQADDLGGNLTCVMWMGEPSSLTTVDGMRRCSGQNLHAVWDVTLITAATGLARHDEATAFAQQLRPFLPEVQAAEPPLTARTAAEWRTVVERWHTETQALILRTRMYPETPTIDQIYIQQHYPTVRRQLLRAAVRLAAMLHQTLGP